MKCPRIGPPRLEPRHSCLVALDLSIVIRSLAADDRLDVPGEPSGPSILDHPIHFADLPADHEQGFYPFPLTLQHRQREFPGFSYPQRTGLQGVSGGFRLWLAHQRLVAAGDRTNGLGVSTSFKLLTRNSV